MHVLISLGAIALSTATLSTAASVNAPSGTVFLDRVTHVSDVTAAIAMTPLPPIQASVTGTVTYRQRIALPDNAIVQVQLLDVSRQDAAATVLGEQTITPNGKQVPFEFEIPYDPAQIQAGHSYAVQARITVGGQLRFVNTSSYPVITNGNPNQIEVLVNSAEVSTQPETLAPQSADIAAQNTVTGTVLYLQRSALPPNSVVEVELQDVSRQDAPAIVLGNQMITTNGSQVPFEFEIPYDPALIQEGHTYAIRARITADRQLLFTNTSRYAVITNGQPNRVEVRVDPVR